jgi:hypothetical protein
MPPVALCTDITVVASPLTCQASANIDANSFDPDADIITITQSADEFDLGDTTVTLTVTEVGTSPILSSICEATVTVVDETAPTVNAGADQTLEATSTSGAAATISPTSDDACSIASVVIDPDLAIYPLGNTTVTATATDGSGNQSSSSMTVTVVDTTAPELNVPADIEVEATGPMTVVNIGAATATDIFPVTVSSNQPASYPLGTTTVTWSATDSNGNQSSGTQAVTVVDTTAPNFDMDQTTDMLWPPNHKMVLVAVISNVDDLVDGNPMVDIQVTSNQDINGNGDGNTDSDWSVNQVGGQWEVRLRAERTGRGEDRDYTIVVTVTDSNGNSSTATTVATVPHDKGGKK